MRLVLLGHPPLLSSQSMPRFAEMIRRGIMERGHTVELWTSPQILGRLPNRSAFVRKWLGYIDQFLIYPAKLRQLVRQQPSDTLFVITDQALGMWVPCLAHRPHVIHCHDFLALRSALGEFPENPTGWSGRQYQNLIRKGFSCGNAFISISEKTREDLHRFLPHRPKISEVVHNGLNHPFRPMERDESMALLQPTGIEIREPGFIVHVGGNQWYKNRRGVLEIYRAFAANHPRPPALWMIGAKPTDQLLELANRIPPPGKVHFLSGLSNEQVNAAYAQARVLLFPSLEEGFGWPVVEAMAAGCLVITTQIAPLTEIAGDLAYFIPRMPGTDLERRAWAQSAAGTLGKVLEMNETARNRAVELGRLNARRFNTQTVLAAYEQIYLRVLTRWQR